MAYVSSGCRLEVVCSATQLGDILAVVGASDGLGAWQPGRALRLSTTAEAFPIWTASLVPGVASGTEFKFAIFGTGDSVTWEPLDGNRRWPADIPDGGVLRSWYGEFGEIVESAPSSCSKELAPQSGAVSPIPRAHLTMHRSTQSRLRERLIAAHTRGHLQDEYELETKSLGEGAFGVVCRARHKQGGDVRAVKSVVKKDIKSVPRLQQEIEITRAMDHPNIVRLFDSFEDDRSIYLVMELCEGSELFDRILETGRLNETQASVLMQQMLKAISYLHGEGISHRDLKPENFLFVDKRPMELSPLKLIDFGLSKRFVPGELLESLVGTPAYVAPEVLSARYGPACDLWSCGVILYILLSGRLPFGGRTDQEMLANAARGRYLIEGGPWSAVSAGPKSLVEGLLRVAPRERLTAAQALDQDWIKSSDPAAAGAGRALDKSLVENLQAWRLEGRFKRAALAAVAGQLSERQINELRDIFTALDTDSSGTLTLEEMREGLNSAGFKVPNDLRQIMEELDTAEHAGVISYTEFLMAALDRRSLALEELCWHAFKAFDTSGDGKISQEELRLVLQHDLLNQVPDAQAIAAEMERWDLDKDGAVEFPEFMEMMRSGGAPLQSH